KTGKRDKIPHDPRTGQQAKTNNPRTWATFAEALDAYRKDQCGRWDGVGYVFSKDDPYTGIDLDSCRDPQTGHLEPWASGIMARVDSYTEASPSGTGVHIIARSTLP